MINKSKFEVEEENKFFKKINILSNLVKQLYDDGVIKENIKIPRICMAGMKSGGKSSILESLFNINIFPIGDGVVTRRPIELNLHHINSDESWVTFEEIKGEKFSDFEKVKDKIESLTDELCYRQEKCIDKPIILNAYSKKYADITLIDLPGIEPIRYIVPKNFELISEKMARRYIKDPLNIILYVISGNSYINLHQNTINNLDINESRTLGILTKLDIMDIGTDVREELLNKNNSFKFDFIGVKLRSKKDRLYNKMSVNEAKEKEKEFFKSHPIYGKMPDGYLGIDALMNKLAKLYFRVIKENLPQSIKITINDILSNKNDEDNDLDEISKNKDLKIRELLNMINQNC